MDDISMLSVCEESNDLHLVLMNKMRELARSLQPDLEWDFLTANHSKPTYSSGRVYSLDDISSLKELIFNADGIISYSQIHRIISILGDDDSSSNDHPSLLESRESIPSSPPPEPLSTRSSSAPSHACVKCGEIRDNMRPACDLGGNRIEGLICGRCRKRNAATVTVRNWELARSCALEVLAMGGPSRDLPPTKSVDYTARTLGFNLLGISGLIERGGGGGKPNTIKNPEHTCNDLIPLIKSMKPDRIEDHAIVSVIFDDSPSSPPPSPIPLDQAIPPSTITCVKCGATSEKTYIAFDLTGSKLGGLECKSCHDDRLLTVSTMNFERARSCALELLENGRIMSESSRNMPSSKDSNHTTWRLGMNLLAVSGLIVRSGRLKPNAISNPAHSWDDLIRLTNSMKPDRIEDHAVVSVVFDPPYHPPPSSTVSKSRALGSFNSEQKQKQRRWSEIAEGSQKRMRINDTDNSSSTTTTTTSPSYSSLPNECKLNLIDSDSIGTGKRITCVAMFPSDEQIVCFAGDDHGVVSIWNAGTPSSNEHTYARGRIFNYRPHSESMVGLMMNPSDCRKLYSVSLDRSIRCMDINKEQFLLISNDQSFTCFGIDLGGSHLYAGTDQGQLDIIDCRASNRSVSSHSLHQGKLTGVSLHPMHSFVHTFATCGIDRSMRLWDSRMIRPSTPIQSFDFASPLSSVSFSQESGGYLACISSDDFLSIFEASSSNDYLLKEDIPDHRFASWDPKRESFMVTFSSSSSPRIIDASQPTIAADSSSSSSSIRTTAAQFHPFLDVLVSTLSTGDILLWRELMPSNE